MGRFVIAMSLMVGISFALYLAGYESGYSIFVDNFTSEGSVTSIWDKIYNLDIETWASIGILASFIIAGSSMAQSMLNFVIYVTVLVSVFMFAPLGFMFDPILPSEIKIFTTVIFIMLFAIIGLELLFGRDL